MKDNNLTSNEVSKTNDKKNSRIKEAINNPIEILHYIITRKPFRLLNDRTYLKILYRLKMGEKLNLDNPKTFDEKLQWLKLYNRKPEYTKLVDKYEVKEYISDKIGKEYIVPTIGIYDKFDDIDFKKLPNKFVIKCTHDSGGNVICRNKDNFDIESAKIKINKCLKNNYYYSGREWPYKNVKPRILIEKYMENDNSYELNDYKLYCFNGKVGFTLVCTGRYTREHTTETFFDENWNVLPFTEGNHLKDTSTKKPKNFDKMLEFSSKLSKGIPHVRIDWYEVKGKLYFGEITFFTESGFEKFQPEEWAYKFGDMIDLTLIKDQIKKNKE